MLCHAIHKLAEGCTEEIPVQDFALGAAWKFCPVCGRSTGHIVVTALDSVFNVPMGTPTKCYVKVRNEGYTPVTVEMELERPYPGIPFVPRQVAVHPKIPQQIDIDLPAIKQDVSQLGTLVLYSHDGPVETENDPWLPRVRRPLRLPLSAKINTPAQVRAIEEVALFHSGLSERSITLVNEGGSRAEILEIVAPPGYSAVMEGDQTRLEGSQEAKCRVRRNRGVPTARESLLLIRTSGDQSQTVELHSEPNDEVRALASAIIGIDFGTTFSTIAFRTCRNMPNYPDDVEFRDPPGETDHRVPTRVWMSKQGELEFGSEADRRYNLDVGAGYRFREIKTLLRDTSGFKDQVDPPTESANALRLLQTQFGEAWGEALVTAYLRWLYRTRILPDLQDRFGTIDVDVRYIFSLPVLDYKIDGQRQYDLQRAAMIRCIQKARFPYNPDVVPNPVEFEFEPVCAALGLLHPPNGMPTDTTRDTMGGARWPVLGSPGYPVKEGNTIAVFDSGGGTTDVVKARVVEEQDEKGMKIALVIERCLGVDSETATFGGEWVTDEISKKLGKPGDFKDKDGRVLVDWYQGEGEFTTLKYNQDDTLPIIEREKAEVIKFGLASEQDYSVSITGGRQTLIKPILLGRVMMAKLQSLREQLDERVFKAAERADTSYYLLVGGNTRLPFLRRWAQGFMNDRENERSLLLPEEYRQLAVAYGAAWVPDARVRNAVPYSLNVFVESQTAASSQLLLSLPRNQSQEIPSRSRNFALPGNQALFLRLEAIVGDRKLRVGAGKIPNSHETTRQVKIWIQLQSGELRIDYNFLRSTAPNDDEPSQNLLTYKL